VTRLARGPFDVRLAPQAGSAETGAPALGRFTLDKQFHGDLEATSRGQMLSGMGAVEGSGGYVAMEVVTGSLEGRTGTLILQHSGVLRRGIPELRVTVVPDSGTGDLTGISGDMKIIIEQGKHSYELVYDL
jgi:hypothetical protein